MNPLVTWQEMCSILMTDAYADFRQLTNFDFSEQKVPIAENWLYDNDLPLLYRHLCAEVLLAESLSEERDEFPKAYSINYLVRITELLMNPLVWMDELPEHIIVDGRWAQELYCPERLKEVREYIQYLQEIATGYFTLDEPCLVEQDRELGYKQEDIFWPILTADYQPLIDKVLRGETIEEQDFKNINFYDQLVLYNRLNQIAISLGGDKATAILQNLQNNWDELKTWRAGMKHMTDDQIKDFEQVLFHGFDDKIKQWLTPTTPPTPQLQPDGETIDDSEGFNPSEHFSLIECQNELIAILNQTKSKSNVCDKIERSNKKIYFNLSCMIDDQKAIWINKWVKRSTFTKPFTANDFSAARKNANKKKKKDS